MHSVFQGRKAKISPQTTCP